MSGNGNPKFLWLHFPHTQSTTGSFILLLEIFPDSSSFLPTTSFKMASPLMAAWTITVALSLSVCLYRCFRNILYFIYSLAVPLFHSHLWIIIAFTNRQITCNGFSEASTGQKTIQQLCNISQQSQLEELSYSCCSSHSCLLWVVRTLCFVCSFLVFFFWIFSTNWLLFILQLSIRMWLSHEIFSRLSRLVAFVILLLHSVLFVFCTTDYVFIFEIIWCLIPCRTLITTRARKQSVSSPVSTE